MGKVTFRADDDLLERVERLDASKSEVMRAALRSYLDGPGSDAADEPAVSDTRSTRGATVDDLIAARVDELVAGRLDELLAGRVGDGGDVNVDVSVEGVGTSGEPRAAEPVPERTAEPVSDAPAAGRDGADGQASGMSDDGVSDATEGETGESDAGTTEGEEVPAPADAAHPAACGQCGTDLAPEHVYCPNCGEKAGGRVFCDCGDELRSDWGFCPSCGRRTPAADVLDGA